MEDRITCPKCNEAMRSGILVLNVDVGILNFISGYSVGSKGIFKWVPDDGGQSLAIRGKNRKIAAQRCEQCGYVLFRLDGK